MSTTTSLSLPVTASASSLLPASGPIGYAESALDRAAHLRPGATSLLEHPQARGLLLGGEMVATAPSGAVEFPVAEARRWSRGKPLFLGLATDDAPRFAFSFDPAHHEDMDAAGLQIQDLRGMAMAGTVTPGLLGALACAKALLAWHGRHRFCANCGTRTRMADSGWRRECPGCGGQHFPRTDPVVIQLVYRGEDALLGRQAHFRPGMYSCLAGFVEPGETPEDAVRRETMEEAGIRVGAPRYLASQPWPFPMSLMLGFMAEAQSCAITMDPSELEDVRWFSRAEVKQMLERSHPDGLYAPGPEAIAHHLIRAFAEGRTDSPA